ncbi:MAG: SoxXA-binding protein [Gammaproteobacteria bacterium]|nr:SoxXA-binding protein [Gammaproteobacteria bacterium]
MKKLALFGALILALSGCASTDNALVNADAAAAKAAITAAEAALKKARSVEGEWRDAKKKLVKKAKSAASKGDYKTAITLANKAKFQGEMGYQQAMEQKNAGPWLF